jgi:plastocyanin
VSNETLFYICGITLAVSAVVVSFVGLRIRTFPGRVLPAVVLYFAALVAASATFAVLNAQDEQEAKANEAEEVAKADAEAAAEAGEPEGGPPPAQPAAGGAAAAGGGAEKGGGPAAAKGPGGTLQLAADPTALAFDKTTLTSKPGKVTIDFDNPSAIQHDVAIEQGGQEIAKSALIAQDKTSVSAELAPGTYTFLCTVPGHAEAGMEGTLTVK